MNYEINVSRTFNDEIRSFYQSVVDNHAGSMKYLDNVDQYHPDIIEKLPAVYYFLVNVEGTPQSCHIVTKNDWMPEGWVRILSRLYNTKEFTSHPDHYKIRSEEFKILSKLPGIQNILVTQNLVEDGEINFENYQDHYVKYKRLWKFFSKKMPDWNFYFDFNQLLYINKTPQISFYASLGDKPDITWLEEFAVHED